jgi:rod shape-determining protein MreC
MPRAATPRILILGVVVVILIANAVVFGGRMFSWVADRTSMAVTVTAARIAWVRSLTLSVVSRTDLAVRVSVLEEENSRLYGQVSQLEDIRREAAAYREVAGITTRPAGTTLQAGVFSYNTVSGVRQAIVNRGTQDGVTVGDVVMTATGALVGSVQSVFTDHATVRRVQDAAFQVTARVSGGDIAGLVRSDGQGALILDLVQKDEAITEGATVVTSGDDRYPVGLLIGTVRSVDNNVATLFQIVRIEPAVPSAVHGMVFIVRP